MVELQKTFSFDEHILPHLLREREKYSGILAEEGYGIDTSFMKDKTVMKTRNFDPKKFIPIQTSCDEYKYMYMYSLWPRTINDWKTVCHQI